ncbi:DUF554 domain-containing protein [Paenibacillus xerothermodurans]|uniref:DUF554 domain-containing protein n=1 Tax=Paenibacillus xerothermodurans TaxID=1977292 RepID=A0A2W1NPY1_PAEXE|nr:DUF554 domain-containing protein [Paenibacillus xerothermodurans]PZE19776.1 DUF554 domain-containing protein [Paenibacillus xerothermodurans]
MTLWGTTGNAAAIIVGALLGLIFHRMSPGIRSTVVQGIGIALLVLGVSMALKSSNFLLVVASLVIGGVIGELLQVERMLDRLGVLLERVVNAMMRLLSRRGSTAHPVKNERGRIAAGFVNTTLIYCVGAMAILGALDGGLRGAHDILYTKAMLDGFLSIIFASTLGVGVMFSALPVFVYQGSIALAASGIAAIIEQRLLNAIITEITAVGGILIIGLGLNLLEIRQINVANLLPSVLVAALAVPFVQSLTALWAGG